jgi:hypothetical protein
MLLVGILAVVVAACGPPGGTVAPSTASTASGALAIPDLAALVHGSVAVIVGRVAGQGVAGTVGPTNPNEVSQPVTTYPIMIERLIRGIAPGDQISVAQFGNPIRGAPPGPDDRPFSPDERYVLFLVPTDAGTYTTVGGVQGRLAIASADRIHTVGSGSPATRAYDGQSLDALVADILAVK